ncbi:hypothetical protein [Brochothrix thermosphacta]|uniref:hypothetical protein n=1 Tax=Brochothrix thermosphacta TaxID=2756 RepID=UPI003F9985DB
MSDWKMKFYKVKVDSPYNERLKHAARCGEIILKVNEELGEEFDFPKVSDVYLFVDDYFRVMDDMTDVQRKLFTKEGKLKKSTKLGKVIFASYQDKLKARGLTDFTTEKRVNFAFGFYKTSREQLFHTLRNQDERYIKTDVSLSKDALQNVVEITEVDFLQAQLEIAKSREVD